MNLKCTSAAMKEIGILLLISLVTILKVNAQSIPELQSYMNAVRTGTTQPLPVSVLADAQNAEKILQALQPYYADSLSTVRSKAYNVAARLGQKTQQPEARQLAVTHLIEGVKDKDTGISGNASDALAGFEIEDFNASHKGKVAALLGQEIPHKDQLVKVIGYLNIKEAQATLKQLAQPGINHKTRWAAYLALARMGEQQELQYIVKTIAAMPLNDDVVYEMVPDLIYTRQKTAFDYLFTIINSDEPSCTSADPDASANILCGYRTMEYIAPYIKDFPLLVEEDELVVDDYKQALREVRTWYAKRQGNYEIVKKGF